MAVREADSVVALREKRSVARSNPVADAAAFLITGPEGHIVLDGG